MFLSIRTAVIVLILLQSVVQSSVKAQSVLPSKPNLNVVYTADLMANTSGGRETGLRYMDNLDVILSSKWNDVSFLVYGLANQGRSIVELAGDIQAISNIDAETSWRLYEAWANVPLKSLKSSLLIGLYDLNSEFDVSNTGSLFLNSSHGMGPEFAFSGTTGPSIFPLTSVGARVKINPVGGLTIKGAILDAIPSNPDQTSGTKISWDEDEGVLMVGEISLVKGENSSKTLDRGVETASPYRLVVGIWQYSKKRTGWNGEHELDAGIYAVVEAKLFSERNESRQGLAAFVRIGAVNQDINRFKNYFGTGLTYRGILPSRPQDALGVALSLPINSETFLNSVNEHYGDETITELTYQWKVSDFLSLQFDAQYIANPNAEPGLEDAMIVGLRSILNF